MLKLRMFSLVLATVAVAMIGVSGASAITSDGGFIELGGAGDPSLHGATGSLEIYLDGTTPATDDYIVKWSITTTGFDDAGAIATNHDELTHVAFKAFTSMTSVTFLSGPVGEDGSGLVWPASFNGECSSGPSGFVCLDLKNNLDMLTDGVTYDFYFRVAGTLNLEEFSYRGKFGTETGWVISEKAPPVPEPTSAAVFGLGALLVGAALRKRLK